jgi:hypothetical protein
LKVYDPFADLMYDFALSDRLTFPALIAAISFSVAAIRARPSS